MSKEVVLDTDLMEVPVIFRSKSGQKTYTIREMTGDELFLFLKENSELAEIVSDGEGKVKVQATNFEKMAGAIPSLLKRCLYDAEGNLVPVDKITKMPLRIQQKLMDIAQEVNALTKKAAEQAGNSTTGNESGTDSLPGFTVPSPSAEEKSE